LEPLPILTALIASASSLAAVVRFFFSTKKTETEPLPTPDLEGKEPEDKDQQTQRSPKKIDGDIHRTIKSEIKWLNDYYKMNKKQATYSFNASISAIILGLITIATGIWLYFIQTSSLPFAAITSISGILSQFIGASYFVMYRTSIRQVNYFFNQLVVMQDTMLTVELAQSLPNGAKPSEKKQIELIEKIVVAVLERSSNLDRGSLALATESIATSPDNASESRSRTRNPKRTPRPKQTDASNNGLPKELSIKGDDIGTPES
jgi:hypothetical protein